MACFRARKKGSANELAERASAAATSSAKVYATIPNVGWRTRAESGRVPGDDIAR